MDGIIIISIITAMTSGRVTILIMTIITIIQIFHEEHPVLNFPEDPVVMVQGITVITQIEEVT
jgi:hypothetical protein